MPPKKRAAQEDASSEDVKQSKTETDSTDGSSPYAGFVFVITGTFPMSSDMIERRIISLGGRVVTAVTKSTTHIMLGESGQTQYGQRTGVGSKKYNESKKKKCIQLTYQELVDAEAALGPTDGDSSGSSSIPASKLQGVWDNLVMAIQAGADKGLWEMPTFKPPATLEEIGAIETEFGFRFGKYNDLLLIANGVSWYSNVLIDGSKEDISLVFGGTGEEEDDLRHAFNYSGDHGRKLFKNRKQVPMQMIDYDFCVNVFEVGSGKIMQDDRECQSYRRLFDGISDWLEEVTHKINKGVEQAGDTGSTATTAQEGK